jgi:hypothetical protein
MTGTDPLLVEINAAIGTWNTSYYLWTTIFYILCVAIIVLPLLVAADIFGRTVNRVLAFLTAAIAAVVNWSNLGPTAATFEEARNQLVVARLAYYQDKNQKALLDAYQKSRAIFEPLRVGVPQAPNTK